MDPDPLYGVHIKSRNEGTKIHTQKKDDGRHREGVGHLDPKEKCLEQIFPSLSSDKTNPTNTWSQTSSLRINKMELIDVPNDSGCED